MKFRGCGVSLFFYINFTVSLNMTSVVYVNGSGIKEGSHEQRVRDIETHEAIKLECYMLKSLYLTCSVNHSI